MPTTLNYDWTEIKRGDSDYPASHSSLVDEIDAEVSRIEQAFDSHDHSGGTLGSAANPVTEEHVESLHGGELSVGGGSAQTGLPFDSGEYVTFSSPAHLITSDNTTSTTYYQVGSNSDQVKIDVSKFRTRTNISDIYVVMDCGVRTDSGTTVTVAPYVLNASNLPEEGTKMSVEVSTGAGFSNVTTAPVLVPEGQNQLRLNPMLKVDTGSAGMWGNATFQILGEIA